MKLLALDIGRKRIGLAETDTRIGHIKTLNTLNTAQGQALKELIKIIKENAYDLLIVGLPLNEQGEETDSSLFVRNYCRRLQKRVEINIEYTDEWGSTIEAKQRLIETKKLPIRSKEKGIIDAQSACIILQSYINSLKSN
jgi:putative Holliday junction resolvase